jgi:hypothetical protein
MLPDVSEISYGFSPRGSMVFVRITDNVPSRFFFMNHKGLSVVTNDFINFRPILKCSVGMVLCPVLVDDERLCTLVGGLFFRLTEKPRFVWNLDGNPPPGLTNLRYDCDRKEFFTYAPIVNPLLRRMSEIPIEFSVAEGK